MHVLGTGVPRRLGVAHSASSPKAAQALGCSPTPRLPISFGRVTCMAWAASVPGLWTLGSVLWCGACVWVWVVLGFGFQLRLATPGRGDGSVCVFVCVLRLYPATPGWGVRCGCVCLGSGFGCAPPLLAEVLGPVCACVPSPLWAPPLLAGVCDVHVCVLARFSAALCHSWLGCWGVCVLVCASRLYPATPGCALRCGCVCLGSGFGCARPLPAGVLGCVCACVCALLVPRHSWLGCAVWVCMLGLWFRLRPATPGSGVGVCVLVCPLRLYPTSPGWVVRAWARVLAALRHSWLGCWGVRVCVSAPPVPRHSSLGCAVWVCVLGFGFRLRPATPGWGVGVCVCLCVRSACTPPLLAGVCGVGVCAWARVSGAPRHSLLGC